jgi:hypothetical protein
MIKSDGLRLFPDEKMIIFENDTELEQIITPLENLNMTFNIKLNYPKSSFFNNSKSFENIEKVSSIRQVKPINYFGF